MGWLWVLATGIGVLLLGLAIVYAFRSNKAAPRDTVVEAEQGAKALRDELEEDPARRN